MHPAIKNAQDSDLASRVINPDSPEEVGITLSPFGNRNGTHYDRVEEHLRAHEIAYRKGIFLHLEPSAVQRLTVKELRDLYSLESMEKIEICSSEEDACQ